jgi:flagellar basal-body rod modification protein FlgD
MAIDAIGVVGNSTTDVLQNSGLSQQDFLEILLTQLRFQDPFKPMDNQQFVAQLAQFSALEINRQQSEKVDSLLGIQATNQGVALIGKQVELIGRSPGTVGEVTAISFRSGEPLLTVKTGDTYDPNVRLSEVVLVTNLESN